ncbi:hypothetical protein [Brevibacillus laterosporus]|uniref:Bacterial Ig-like domain-containing protein n=1 Tax=Brevibacillus laterosporus TaxID=1465 RepID=A0AAP3GD48_BRELA|nr:hypothetical protein [Brevibacillus laterosporus]MCR8982439.1 hypothetical protein [Brevibacillus laterosporus]MCZ0809595.1 hypothetical protein [Brevibacillus laterosporus]MCZ0828128.1 hypothetical protein [Brevibacillus laterosporus]MCZ0852150.1 hypothetical protein [Brevibacillus laterosporus]
MNKVKYTAKYIAIFSMCLSILLPTLFLFIEEKAHAEATTKTMVIKLPETGDSTKQTQTKEVTIPNIKNIVSVKSNTGKATTSLSGSTVTVTATNGTRVRKTTEHSLRQVGPTTITWVDLFYGTETEKPTLPLERFHTLTSNDKNNIYTNLDWKEITETTTTGTLYPDKSHFHFNEVTNQWVGYGYYYGGGIYGNALITEITKYYAYEVTITYIDNTAPTISVATPPNQFLSEVSGRNSLTVTGTTKDVDAGDKLTVKYTIDNVAAHTGKTVATLIANGRDQAFSINIPIDSTIPEGTHTLKIWTEDDKGGSAPAVTRTFIVDKTPPEVPTIQEDPKGNAPTKNITIAFAKDVVVKDYQINGGKWITYTTPFSVNKNGKITARGTDAAGNSSTQDYQITSIIPAPPQPVIMESKENIIKVKDKQTYLGSAVERKYSILDLETNTDVFTSEWTDADNFSFTNLSANKQYKINISVQFKP